MAPTNEQPNRQIFCPAQIETTYLQNQQLEAFIIQATASELNARIWLSKFGWDYHAALKDFCYNAPPGIGHQSLMARYREMVAVAGKTGLTLTLAHEYLMAPGWNEAKAIEWIRRDKVRSPLKDLSGCRKIVPLGRWMFSTKPRSKTFVFDDGTSDPKRFEGWPMDMWNSDGARELTLASGSMRPPEGVSVQRAEHIVREFMSRTDMIFSYAHQCLAEHAWNFNSALATFQSLLAPNVRVPLEAFASIQRLSARTGMGAQYSALCLQEAKGDYGAALEAFDTTQSALPSDAFGPIANAAKFFRLPGELRTEIYKYVYLAEFDERCTRFLKGERPPPDKKGLVRVSSGLRKECLRLFKISEYCTCLLWGKKHEEDCQAELGIGEGREDALEPFMRKSRPMKAKTSWQTVARIGFERDGRLGG